MNETGTLLLWCVIQATVNLLFGAAVYLVARRFGPATGAWAAACALVVLCGVTVAAFSPWPRWWSPGEQQRAGADATSQSSSPADAGENPRNEASIGATAARDDGLSLTDSWRMFRDELQAAATTSPADVAPRRWPKLIAAALIAAAALALIRITVGLLALARYRRRLRPIDDPRLAALARSVAQALGCRRRIELRQSASLTTPATLGWLRPVIVLPGDWQAWSEAERRVVLAHETAHIARGDYLAWLAAQLAVALHVYHPLAHWLAGRLRLEQELAADACAAEASGGRENYLFTLAQMALRQDDRSVAWAARPFLPTRGTLLRRIEMLSDNKRLQNRPVTRRRAAALAGMAIIMALAISGIRAPIGGDGRAHAAPPDQPAAAAPASAPLDVSYAPPQSVFVAAVRPAHLLQREGMQPLVKLLNDAPNSAERRAGVRLENIEQVTIAIAALPGERVSPRQVTLTTWRATDAFDWIPYAKSLAGEGDPIEVDLGGKKYFKAALPEYFKPANPDEAQRFAFYLPDDRTIVTGPENLVRQVLLSGGRSKAAWVNQWQALATGAGAVMIDMAAVNQAWITIKQQAPQDVIGALVGFAPLWEKGRRLFFTAQLDGGLNLSAQVDCDSADDAVAVRETAQAALTLARNALEEVGKQAVRARGPDAAITLPLSDLAVEAIKQSKLETNGKQVTLHAQLDTETAVSTLAPAVTAARRAAQRSQAMNNIKQIMIAMHNFYDVNGHFPPPVVLGPDGKTPHSWRVAILPYLEQMELHKQYKINEPWDSPDNKKVLAQMPAVFRDPAADAATLETSYFALVGTETAFGPKGGNGTKFPEITDGTSNTIAIVEAKRAVPWTKPEDIDYDAGKPLPRLSGLHDGGFLTGFCDGSVHFIADTIDPQMLRAVITRAGGERISLP
ncbi:MAG TPA: M56 family metallopeptidase [Pirellulales bacterium]